MVKSKVSEQVEQFRKLHNFTVMQLFETRERKNFCYINVRYPNSKISYHNNAINLIYIIVQPYSIYIYFYSSGCEFPPPLHQAITNSCLFSWICPLMTKVHIPAPTSTAGKTVWQPDHTPQQRDKQDVSLKNSTYVWPSYSNDCLVSEKWRRRRRKKKIQPCHRRRDIKKVSPLYGRHERNI